MSTSIIVRFPIERRIAYEARTRPDPDRIPVVVILPVVRVERLRERAKTRRSREPRL